jgi:cytidylate kinase
MGVITISRQWGSGAEEIAVRVCELLNYRYLDKYLITQVATELGLTEHEMIDFSTEHYTGKSFLERLLRPGPYVVAELPVWTQDETGAETLGVKKLDEVRFVNFVRRVLLAAYHQGDVVIMGRGGQAVLQDSPEVLHVRIEAPMGARLRRIQEREGIIDVEKAYQLAVERDRKTAQYLGQLFGVRGDDPFLYHLLLNTDKWETEAAAQVIVAALQQLVAK